MVSKLVDTFGADPNALAILDDSQQTKIPAVDLALLMDEDETVRYLCQTKQTRKRGKLPCDESYLMKRLQKICNQVKHCVSLKASDPGGMFYTKMKTIIRKALHIYLPLLHFAGQHELINIALPHLPLLLNSAGIKLSRRLTQELLPRFFAEEMVCLSTFFQIGFTKC
jgi:hypothetical protein